MTRDGRWPFLVEGRNHVQVFADRGFAPRLVHTVAVSQQPVGSSLTADGRYLLIANSSDGATVLSSARLEAGKPHPVLGILAEPGHRHFGGAIEVTSSPDGRYAFVSLEDANSVAVYNLRAALEDGFRSSSYVGSARLGNAVVGLAISPDGRWLYATSERADATSSTGTLSVLSVQKAERQPARAVVATVAAQCSPVRAVASSDGSVVWVSARESDQLLAFSARKLRTDPTHALLTTVRVGEAPVGLALVDQGRRIVVADSDRFNKQGAHANLTVVNVAAALAHRPAVLGTIPAGAFPREMSLEPNGRTLLVSNNASNQLEAVAVGHLP